MPANDSINRRQFLEKSSLVAAAAAAVGGAREASAQLNNSAAVNLKPVRLGFIGVGIRGTLLMEAAAGIAGVEIKAAADCYKGHLDARPGADQPRPRSHRRLQGDPLPPRHRRRRDRDARPLAPADDAGGAGGRQARLHREADDPPLGGRRGLHRGRREEREGAAGGQPVHEHGRRAEGGRLHQERAAGAGHPRRGPLPPQHRDRRLVLPDPARRLADDRGLQELPRLRRAPRLRPPPLLPVAPLLGLLGRPAHRPLRAHRHRHPPAHGRLGAGERLQLRRHLPLEELPRGPGPDDLDGEVPGGLRAPPLEHREQRPPRAAPHRLRQRGDARVHGLLLQVLLRAAHGGASATRPTPGRRRPRPGSSS